MLSNSESTAVGRERTAPKTDGLSNPNDERDLEESDAAVCAVANAGIELSMLMVRVSIQYIQYIFILV